MNSERVQDNILRDYADDFSKHSMGLHSFQELAKEARAVYHVKQMVLVNTEKIDKYLENFCDEN